MAEPVPIACTLTPADLAAQARRWKRLIAGALTGRTEIADGLRLSFRPEAADELRALSAVEAECCPWASWIVTAGPGETTLDVRAPADGAAVVREMFRVVPSGGRESVSSPDQAPGDSPQ
jgi:MerR family transcriptional regulator, copper efflux regulator